MAKSAKSEEHIVSKGAVIWTFVGLIFILLLLTGVAACGPTAPARGTEGAVASASPSAIDATQSLSGSGAAGGS